MPSEKSTHLPFLVLIGALAVGCGSEEDPGKPAQGSEDAGLTVDGSTAVSDAATLSQDAGDSGSSSNPGTPGADAGGSGSDAGGSGTDAGSGADASTVDPATLPKFSFFVTSQDAIMALGGTDGFGGDLRHGETGEGAGIRGADKLCAEIAELSMDGASSKQWRAFLSASTGGANGGALHARDRIGSGPWYDRLGRLVGNNLTDLLDGNRPSQANSQIALDLPNETGTPNHNPGSGIVDNHDTLTGSDTNGRYVSGANTCSDWTSAPAKTSGGGGGGGGGGGSGPNIGHSWPRNGDASSVGNGHWVSAHKAGGCAKGINTGNISSDGTNTVGSGGGYGGFYCFALKP